MVDRTFNVLFLCTGNSCRSILAESLLNYLGRGRFRAYSAGSHPAGLVNPEAIATLERRDLPTDGFRSKSWDEFAAAGAPAMDFVITVCDNAAGETCPVWPGLPLSAHWGIPDPALFRGGAGETAAFFDEVLGMLETRIAALAALPLDRLPESKIAERLAAIGVGPGPS